MTSQNNRDLDELSGSSSTIIPVLAILYSQKNTPDQSKVLGMDPIPVIHRLFPFVSHSINSVAIITMNALYKVMK